MIPSNDIVKRRKEIENLIADAHIDRATKRLMDFASDFSCDKEHRNETIAISSTYNRLREYERRGTLAVLDFDHQLNMLVRKVLDLLDDIVDQFGFEDAA